MNHEDLRAAHEEIERLEKAIADRILEKPNLGQQQLMRDHEIADMIKSVKIHSERALHIYKNEQDALMQEAQYISTGDTFAKFFKEIDEIKRFHQKYDDKPVENPELTYKRTDEQVLALAARIDSMFTGEEGFGKFFDLTLSHEDYLNLPGVKGHIKVTYLQYLDVFDSFTPPQLSIGRREKLTDEYFSYVGSLGNYLESFMRRTKPLENIDKIIGSFDEEFDQMWETGTIPGWEKDVTQTNGNGSTGPIRDCVGEEVWCDDCEKKFANENVYKSHLNGKKHVKNSKARQQRLAEGNEGKTEAMSGEARITENLRERIIAQREHRVRKLASTMSTEREDTRVNVERKAGMTDRERQQELAALYADDTTLTKSGANGDVDDDDDEAKIYNPLKLPLAWDGKPIPYWLYRLHGLGVEYSCEICGNYVYKGRREYERHFSDARHVYGLKCLGITNTSMFREITKIDEANRLWEKIVRDKAKEAEKHKDVLEMEDTQGNVMPYQVYEDLSKQGLL